MTRSRRGTIESFGDELGELTGGERYRVLIADPPWPYEDTLPGSGRGAAKHYDVPPTHDPATGRKLTRAQRMEYIYATELPPMHDDCVMFMWRVAPMAKEAHLVEERWGFEHKNEIAWLKRWRCGKCKGAGEVRGYVYAAQLLVPNVRGGKHVDLIRAEKGLARCPNCGGSGMTRAFPQGRIVRGEHEICLISARGRYLQHLKIRNMRSTFEALVPVDENDKPIHSAKPDEFYDIVRALFPGPYFELHARKQRDGFDQRGHQLGHIGGAR